jgi:protein-S-isoprenylcysteine O-methyltransferase Ste14
MTMGTGVVLFVIGAILAFAVRVQVSFISLSTAGYILMVAGVVVFLIGLALAIRGRRTVTTARTTADPLSAQGVTERSTRTTDPDQL